MADGSIVKTASRARKSSAGYDLTRLLVGSEGTLGIITAAALKLFPSPSAFATALVAVPSPAAALDLLSLARNEVGSGVTALELMPRIGIEFVVRHAGLRDPFAAPAPWYSLIELSGHGANANVDAAMEVVLSEAFARGLVLDAAIAKNNAEAKTFWRYREALSEVQKFEGGSLKHDIAVPVSRTPDFIAKATAVVEKLVPGIRPVPFGHLGDGNIHFNLSQPVGADRAAFLDRLDAVADAVHAVVAELGGTVSAEHGIGRAKRDLMPAIKNPVELDLMRSIKHVLDPKGILNAGKLID
jgi:FAD/FMN-containing dehydrogenase